MHRPNIKKGKKKMFTHRDADGMTCAVTGNIFFGKGNLDAEYHSYESLFKAMKKLFKNHDKLNSYDTIYLTDMNINESQYLELKKLAPNFDFNNKFKMFDHHPTSLPMNKYEFATVIVEENGIKTCGALLLYNYLVKEYKDDLYYNLGRTVEHYLGELIEHVRQWDTWDWVNTGNTYAKHINSLSMIQSIKDFVNNTTSRLIWGKSVISKQEMAILEFEEKQINRYCKNKENEVKPLEIAGYNLGCLFAEQYQSELGNHLSNRFPKYDGILMIDIAKQKCSLRTSREGVDMSILAKMYNGGGHIKACGFTLPFDNLEVIEAVKNKLK